MTKDILFFAAHSLEAGQPVALITITNTHGSSPASPGQMMAVLADGTMKGTVGGGASEYNLAKRAVQALKSGEKSFTFSFDHSEDGMVCGGGMDGYATILGAGPKLLLFGGGHVGQQIAPLATNAGFLVTVVEDRPELASAFTDVQYLVCTPEDYTQKIQTDANTYAVICTRGHKTDDDALRFLLNRPLDYLGMIGSKRKVTTLLDNLRKDGVPEETLAKLYAPIGLDVASGAPAEIAIAVMAEILLVKNGGSPNHKKLLQP